MFVIVSNPSPQIADVPADAPRRAPIRRTRRLLTVQLQGELSPADSTAVAELPAGCAAQSVRIDGRLASHQQAVCLHAYPQFFVAETFVGCQSALEAVPGVAHNETPGIDARLPTTRTPKARV